MRHAGPTKISLMCRGTKPQQRSPIHQRKADARRKIFPQCASNDRKTAEDRQRIHPNTDGQGIFPPQGFLLRHVDLLAHTKPDVGNFQIHGCNRRKGSCHDPVAVTVHRRRKTSSRQKSYCTDHDDYRPWRP